uniref:Immunoglobulin V-set domain-containing protein n=1 Tax=Salarias fasciatus TaxID=181472 RepID=A0A672JP03_SALFA
MGWLKKLNQFDRIGINNITCLKLSAIFISCFTVQSSVPPVFVQKGKDVLLDVNNVPEDFTIFVWKLEKENSILVTFYPGGNSKISKAYTGRIDHPDNKKYSVILKNLQETDSRVYTGRLTTDDGDSTLVQHNIIGINQRSQTPALLCKSTCWMLQ